MENQRKRIDLTTVLYSVFILVWMDRGDITTNAEIINSTGIWKSSRGMFLKFEEMVGDDLSAVLFVKSKGFFNLTGTKAPARENGTFYLNAIQSNYAIGIAGQFLICDHGKEQLRVALLLGANKNCDYDVFSRNSIHTFFRVEESNWFNLESECLSRESNNIYDSIEEITTDSREDANCTLSGFWINEYNSTMNLTADERGNITGVYYTEHERANGTSGDGMSTFHGWKGDNSMFTFSMIWNRGTSVTTLLGVNHQKDDGTCGLWVDFALIIAQHSCANAWKFSILSSYNRWTKLD